MLNTITKALIYESQGLKDDALEVYKNILKADPNNKEAISAIRRLSGIRRSIKIKNEQMKDFFVDMSTPEEINEFKRWLIKL
ncbi:hypothetical protein CPIN17260_0856 [Campylobacter pinnipediorum subsp. pinnipediorum]|uniref:tetratricopeptide repeat protein n=1 Tax=Campylobacter pinnipediorum TaxID=1965231 RepID=UPI0009951468|nr:tetratricopeptide repeat protein [Campylobacter pinnipediorum]AQW81158.1 hypothetical protein CPIN17260_0856 [Campylobacter pinnipediorum subsp. pinnipediorum]